MRWLAPVVLLGCADGSASPRLHEIQALGTHNSYHRLAGRPADPALDYVHDPLPDQLDDGVRHFELDAHRDAESGAIAVYHIKHVDEASSCATLSDCLLAIRAWSDAHRRHHLVVVLVEPKDDLARVAVEVGVDPAGTGELPWAGHVAELDAVIRAAWPDRLLTPADVQGGAATLREAITTTGWPTVDATRQRIAVVLNDTDTLRDEYRAVVEPAAFVFGDAGDPDEAFVKLDDPAADPQRLAEALAAGFIVRSRADADTEVDAAATAAVLASGAQLVSTDYPVARDDGAHPGYRLPWPGTPERPSRCNPVTADPDCRDGDIE